MLSHHSPLGLTDGQQVWAARDQPNGQWNKYRWSSCGVVHSQNQSRIWLAPSWCLDGKVFWGSQLSSSSSPANSSQKKTDVFFFAFLQLCPRSGESLTSAGDRRVQSSVSSCVWAAPDWAALCWRVMYPYDTTHLWRQCQKCFPC